MIVVLSLLAVCLGVFVVVSVIDLNQDTSVYVLPRDATDWSGWAAGLGALGTTGALIYAALKFRSDADEQIRLRLDRDAEAKKLAKHLTVEVKNAFDTECSDPVTGIKLKIVNFGQDDYFDVQVKVPDFTTTVKVCWLVEIPQEEEGFDPLRYVTREDSIEDRSPICPYPQENRLWLCGDIPAQHALFLSIDFTQPNPVGASANSSSSDQDQERDTRVAVIFSDPMGRTWVRSTEGRRALQRLWPESFVVEDGVTAPAA